MSSQPDCVIVADGLGFPEGPIWLRNGDLLVVEIAAQQLTRITPNGRKYAVAKLEGGPNGAAIGPDGQVYICNNGGFSWAQSNGFLRPVGAAPDYTTGWIERVDPETGKVERLFDNVDGIPLTGPNDIVFDRDGGFWFTDHGKKHGRQMDLGAVFYVGPSGSKQAAFPLLGPNGIGLSPDEQELYVAETPTGRLWAYQIDRAGELALEDWQSPTGGRLVCGLPGLQRYDSLAVEANGAISVACLREGGIATVSPAGELVQRIHLDDPYTTNICFGGEAMQAAYLTSSGAGKLVMMPWARPGHVLNFQK
jgi:gluconolactonase